MQMLAALLLAFAVASPALAEVACAVEGATHQVAADDHSAFPAGEDGNDGAADDADGHCAFSHSHCSAVAAQIRSDMPAFADEVPPSARSSALLRQRASTGPERPPRI